MKTDYNVGDKVFVVSLHGDFTSHVHWVNMGQEYLVTCVDDEDSTVLIEDGQRGAWVDIVDIRLAHPDEAKPSVTALVDKFHAQHPISAEELMDGSKIKYLSVEREEKMCKLEIHAESMSREKIEQILNIVFDN